MTQYANCQLHGCHIKKILKALTTEIKLSLICVNGA